MIDYLNIYYSTRYYEGAGFKRIEAPWTVTQAISDITRPQQKKDFLIEGKSKVLVASGEQSFLYLYLKGFLPKGRFQTVTPCFRDEPFDGTHTKYFIKNELIDTENVTDKSLDKMILYAAQFFKDILGVDVEKIPTADGFDLEYKGIELGSYGIRRCDYLNWIYGKGCAEPRLSYVKNIISNGGLSQ